MRGLRRAYDPHLAARHWCQLFLLRLVQACGSPLPYGVGLSGELTSPSGSCSGCPMGTYLPFTRGLSREIYVSPASAGNVSGCGLRVLGMVHIGGQGWFGEAPECPVFLIVLLPVLRVGGLITAQKGDIRAAVSLTILHLYTHRLYFSLYGLLWTAIEHRIINC
jgi:hypothetical protein